jgi:hypothetical protein
MLDAQALAGGRNRFLDRLRDGELTLMLGIRSSRTAMSCVSRTRPATTR